MSASQVNLDASARLRRTINVLGAAAAGFALLLAALSYFLAASQPMPRNFHQVLLFAEAADHLSFLAGPLRAALRDGGPFHDDIWFFLAYCGPLAAMTAIALAALVLLWRARQALTDEHVKRALFWCAAIALASAPAFNVLTQDFWLLPAWGRMVNEGLNPFDVPFNEHFTDHLPLDHAAIRATYGPIWILLSSLITAISLGSPFVMWLLFKGVLVAAWVAILNLVAAMTKNQSPIERCAALILLGWAPLCVHTAIAEGHNDVLMTCLMLLWLARISAFDRAGPLALAASALTKYVTAPLAIVDLVYHRAQKPLAILLRGLPAAIGFVAIALIFLHSPAALTQTTDMAGWRFFDLANLLRLIEEAAHIHIPSAQIMLIAGLGLCLYKLLPLWREPTDANAREAVLTIMAALLFTVVGHVWPWFFIWVVPVAVLRLSSPIAWFVLGASLVAPFVIAHWWRWGDASNFVHITIPVLAMYGAAALSAVAAIRFKRRMSAERSGLAASDRR